jgi:hypothetical protein
MSSAVSPKRRHIVLADRAQEDARRTQRFGTMAGLVELSLLWIVPAVTLGTHFGLGRTVPAIDALITDEAPPFPIR